MTCSLKAALLASLVVHASTTTGVAKTSEVQRLRDELSVLVITSLSLRSRVLVALFPQLD